MTYPEIIEELLRVLPETPRELLRARQQPVVLIRYQRKHFKARDAALPIRITLDHHIEGFEQIGAIRPVAKFKMPLHDRIVLEAKSTIGKEKNIPKLLYPLRPRQSRFSKYVLTCSQLGLAAGINEHFTLNLPMRSFRTYLIWLIIPAALLILTLIFAPQESDDEMVGESPADLAHIKSDKKLRRTVKNWIDESNASKRT